MDSTSGTMMSGCVLGHHGVQRIPIEHVDHLACDRPPASRARRDSCPPRRRVDPSAAMKSPPPCPAPLIQGAESSCSCPKTTAAKFGRRRIPPGAMAMAPRPASTATGRPEPPPSATFGTAWTNRHGGLGCAVKLAGQALAGKQLRQT